MEIQKIIDSIPVAPKSMKMIDYNLEEAIKSLVRIGKSIRSNFNIDDHNSNFFTNLIKYQFNDPSCEFDLNKGLLLHGNIGVGKTIAMMLFEKKLDIKYFPRRYKIVTCWKKRQN